MFRKKVFPSAFGRIVVICVFLVVLLTMLRTSVTFGDQNLPHHDDKPIYEGDALYLDAQHYASEYAVSVDEAVRRLNLQDAIGMLGAELATNEEQAFAGLWIEHTPEFRVVVQFTKNDGERIRPYISNPELADILIEVREVDLNLAELKEIHQEMRLSMQALDVPFDSDINLAQNQVELYTTNTESFDSALQRAEIQLPAHVKMVAVQGLSRETAQIFAGLALTPICTSGFSVIHSSGTKGITTAGHCDDVPHLYYNGVHLPHQAGIDQHQYDVQWRTAPGFNVRNLAFDGTWNRYVYGAKHRDHQEVGEWVCKYGKVTGGGCGTIVTKDFNGTYIRVTSNNNVDLGEPGDSGGPWFSGNTAYGLMTGDFPYNNDAYYMAINYINILGLSVLNN